MIRTLKILRKALQLSSRFVNTVGMFTLLITMFITVGDVSGRNLLGMPIEGVYELTKFLLAVFVLLGIAYTQQIDGHIRITFLFSQLPFRAKQYIESVTLVISLPFLAVITWQGWEYTRHTYHSKLTSDVLHIPVWPFTSLVAVGGGLLCLEFLITLIDRLHKLARGKSRRKVVG
jgi:TRAP-type C4-dicarboxylate transport system permease small subunit